MSADTPSETRQLVLTTQYLRWALSAALKGLHPDVAQVTIVFDLDNNQNRSTYTKRESVDESRQTNPDGRRRKHRG